VISYALPFYHTPPNLFCFLDPSFVLFASPLGPGTNSLPFTPPFRRRACNLVRGRRVQTVPPPGSPEEVCKASPQDDFLALPDLERSNTRPLLPLIHPLLKPLLRASYFPFIFPLYPPPRFRQGLSRIVPCPLVVEKISFTAYFLLFHFFSRLMVELLRQCSFLQFRIRPVTLFLSKPFAISRSTILLYHLLRIDFEQRTPLSFPSLMEKFPNPLLARCLRGKTRVFSFPFPCLRVIRRPRFFRKDPNSNW